MIDTPRAGADSEYPDSRDAEQLPRLVATFFLEQALGHRTYSQNLCRALQKDPTIDAEIVEVAPHSAPRGLKPVWHYGGALAVDARIKLESSTRKRPPDCLFIHTQVLAVLARSIIRRIPTVISMDASPVDYDTMGGPYGHRRGKAPVEALKRRHYRRLFDAAAGLTVFSGWAADSLIDHYGVPGEKIQVIPPGIDIRRFAPPPDARTSARLRILFVGGDFVRKGGPQLLAALDGLGRDVEVTLLTSAPVSAPPGALVVGGLAASSPELIAHFQSADVLVLPTLAETYGIVIVEAMACGLPVIATPVGAIPGLIQDGVNGLLVEPGSVEQLRAALRHLADRPDIRSQMGSANRAKALLEFDLQVTAPRIFRLLRQIVAA